MQIDLFDKTEQLELFEINLETRGKKYLEYEINEKNDDEIKKYLNNQLDLFNKYKQLEMLKK